MKLVPNRILRATFVDRPNRFLVNCQIGNKGCVEAQLPNPGRLSELLLPGATLYVSEAFPKLVSASHPTDPVKRKGSNPRKTRYTVWAVERDGQVIFLHTHRTNRVARYLLDSRRIRAFQSARVVQTEVPHGSSRFDFLMEERGERFFLEVKSVTLFGNGAALFPDAVTDRGRHHLLKLAELGEEAVRRGLPKPAVLFVAHSDRVDRFLPDYHTDLAFAKAFLEVRDRVRLHPVAVGWSRSLRLKDTVRELPIPWDFLHQEVQDGGAYLLLLRVAEPKLITVGRLGQLGFPAGWYVYVGSAAKALTARIGRHLRKRKRFHWHIDFLRDKAVKALALPIRSSRKEECDIAKELARIMSPHSPGFGCSDCSCPTHLYFSTEKPLDDHRFHKMLEGFRMPVPFSG